MKVYQISNNLSRGDSITNCIMYLKKILDKHNIENYVAILEADSEFLSEDVIVFDRLSDLNVNNDIVLYHFYGGVRINYPMEQLMCKKVLIYHNVTPPDFFRGIDESAMLGALKGCIDAHYTCKCFQKAIVLSEFSKKDLVSYGWNEDDVIVMPIVLPRKDTRKRNKDDSEIIKKYMDGKINILFVGRIIMNKRIEDLLHIFNYYQKKYNKNSRLLIVGSICNKVYYKALCEMIIEQKIDGVIFTDKVSDQDLNAYYEVANLYLSMSEHEGFCIPLVEAMEREIPVMAYASSAVPETMGEAGVLLKSKEDIVVAEKINKIIGDKEYRNNIIENEKKRVKDIYLFKNEDKFIRLLEEINSDSNNGYNLLIRNNSFLFVQYNDKSILELLYETIKRKVDHIVIYGAGKIGHRLVRIFAQYSEIHIDALCDNYCIQTEFEHIRIFKKDECIENYPKSFYIISVQNNYIGILKSLMDSGIPGKNIVYYNSKQNKFMY